MALAAHCWSRIPSGVLVTLSAVGPLLSVVIPTRNRPGLLPIAIESALSQTVSPLEVIVVDNGSEPPVAVRRGPRLRVIRCPNGGTATARNAGVQAARARWVTCLDDDDRLLSHMAEVSLQALERCELPPPVGVISGLEVISADGRVVQRRIPPTRPRGAHFPLEPLEPGRVYETTYLTKQTLLIARRVLLALGGWDECFRSLVHTELFLRLNPVCSILGVPEVTYQKPWHDGDRLSGDPVLRRESFRRLERKHRGLLEAHPLGHAQLLRWHARKLWGLGDRRAAAAAAARAVFLEQRALPVSARPGQRWRPATWLGSERTQAQTHESRI